MPNCFQLLRNGNAVPLNTIDEEMCRHFGAPCHEKHYFEGWYDFIGYELARGQSFAEIRLTYANSPILVQIVDWLEANFQVNAWYELRSHPRQT